jgi:hypothetical protein
MRYYEIKEREKCEWVYGDEEIYCIYSPKVKLNGKVFCEHHFEIFKLIDRQFNILEKVDGDE